MKKISAIILSGGKGKRMNSDISKVNSSINIAKFTKKIVIQNIVFALAVKVIALVIAGANILGSFGMYLAVLSDVGVCLITILNTLRIIYKKTKKFTPDQSFHQKK